MRIYNNNNQHTVHHLASGVIIPFSPTVLVCDLRHLFWNLWKTAVYDLIPFNKHIISQLIHIHILYQFGMMFFT